MRPHNDFVRLINNCYSEMKGERRPLSVESRWTGPGWVTRGIPRAIYHSFGLSIWKSTSHLCDLVLEQGLSFTRAFSPGTLIWNGENTKGAFHLPELASQPFRWKRASVLCRNYVGTDRAAFDPTDHPFRNRVIFARSSSQFDGTDTFRLRMNPLSRRSVLKNGMHRKSCRIGMVSIGRRGGRH